MIEEYENKKALKDIQGCSPTTGTYTGTVIPSDLEKDKNDTRR